MKVVIIGSGLAGLTAGALLAKEGYEVKIFEQHEKIGGVTATIEKDGYRWDWGQMLVPDLSKGEPGRKILEKLGISDKVKTVQSYRENYFPDFRISKPSEYQGIYWRKKYFKKLFPEDSKGLDKYYNIYDRIHDIAALFEKDGLLSKLKLFFKFLPLLRKKSWSAQRLMDYCFSNKKLQAVYTAILADYVISPSVFPGLLIPTINAESQYDERVPLDYGNHEHRQSWSFVINGVGKIVDALAEAFINYGGEIITETAVKKISIKDGSAKSVVTEHNKDYEADLIIASGGAEELFLDLIGREFLPNEYLKTYIDDLYTTESVFMIHLGVDYDPSVHQNDAALCYYYFTYDIDDSIKECKKKIYHEGEDGLLVYIPSVHSPNMAPKGHHAVTVYTIAPNNPINGSWKNDKDKWAEKLLDLAEEFIPGLREHEQTRIILTPEEFRNRTYLKSHAFGGTVPHLEIPPPTHETPIENLWFIGAQSQTYGGVTGALTGAENVVNKIISNSKHETDGTTFKKFSK
jgi:phytoene dehydrogenase-like protein